MANSKILISQDNPWQFLVKSLDLFSEDFIEDREQLNLQLREELFE